MPGLRGTGLADTILPWRDVLHEGPVPDVPDDELRRVRTAFLAGENADDIGTATRAWASLRAPDPGGLGAVVGTPSRERRFLGEAFDRLSREYPSTRDGLALTERRILAAVAEGASTAGDAFVRTGVREVRPYLGDTWCFDRMRLRPACARRRRRTRSR